MCSALRRVPPKQSELHNKQTPPPSSQSFPNSSILPPSQPYLVLRDTLCSCEAYEMRTTQRGKTHTPQMLQGTDYTAQPKGTYVRPPGGWQWSAGVQRRWAPPHR